MQKLSVLLGLRDRVEKTFGNMLDDMLGKFKNKQSLFKGYQKTYQAFDGYADEPTKRGYQNVSSTVGEQLQWFKENTKDYFDVVFGIEKTNSAGVYADLVVDGDNWGRYSTLELLRLKSVLDGKLRGMIQEIPVRNDTTIWTPSTDGNHVNRDVFANPLDEGHSKTTIKESYILFDPHLADNTAVPNNRQPIVGEKSTQVNIGKYTSQDFSGEYSLRERAELSVRYDKLYKAVIEALENANNLESLSSDLGDKFLNYLLK